MAQWIKDPVTGEKTLAVATTSFSAPCCAEEPVAAPKTTRKAKPKTPLLTEEPTVAETSHESID